MYSDESRYNEREFNYPEEKALNQMTPINLFPNFKKMKSKKINVIYRVGGLYGKKTVPEVLSTAGSLRPKADGRTHDQGHSFFPYGPPIR